MDLQGEQNPTSDAVESLLRFLVQAVGRSRHFGHGRGGNWSSGRARLSVLEQGRYRSGQWASEILIYTLSVTLSNHPVVITWTVLRVSSRTCNRRDSVSESSTSVTSCLFPPHRLAVVPVVFYNMSNIQRRSPTGSGAFNILTYHFDLLSTGSDHRDHRQFGDRVS